MKTRDQFMHSNGTTSFETYGLIFPSFLYNFLLCFCINVLGNTFKRWQLVQLMFEFIVIVVPIILNITILVPYSNTILVSLLVLVLTISIAFRNLEEIEEVTIKKKPSDRISFLIPCRAVINLISVIAILAVDFTMFPRRCTKTLTYGYSLMDVGVGLFVFSNGIVAPEIHGHKNSVFKTLKNVIPLTVLGAARFLLTKEVDYYVSVSEYGVHWNFFITLAVTKVISSLILNFISVENSIFSGISILLAHEIILQLGLGKFVLSNVPRNNFFVANREGIVSSLGYVGLYFLSVAFGRFCLSKAKLKWKNFAQMIMISFFLLWATLILEKNFGVSRRLANSGYCIWVLFIGVSMMSFFYLTEILFGFFIFKGTNFVLKIPLVFQAINYNGLVFFLLANLLTGLINVSVDTLQVGTVASLIIVVCYMLVNCGVVYLLFVKEIKIKL